MWKQLACIVCYRLYAIILGQCSEIYHWGHNSNSTFCVTSIAGRHIGIALAIVVVVVVCVGVGVGVVVVVRFSG